MKKFIHIVNQINRAMGAVAGCALVLLSLVVFYDVICRYFFRSPTIFAFDLSIWLTGFAAFLSGGYVLLHKGHIRVDIFFERYPEKIKGIVEFISSIFMMMLALTFIWYGGARVLQLLESGAVASTGFNIPLWIKWSIVPLGGLLLGLQVLINLIRDIIQIFTGKRVWEEETE